MDTLLQRVAGFLAWRSNRPAPIRWLGAMIVFLAALSARFALGLVHGANPGLTFYPAILLVSVIFGWKEALAVLVLSVIAGVYWFQLLSGSGVVRGLTRPSRRRGRRAGPCRGDGRCARTGRNRDTAAASSARCRGADAARSAAATRNPRWC